MHQVALHPYSILGASPVCKLPLTPLFLHLRCSCCVQVMAEVYDEFVFVNPTKEWFDMLHSGPTRKVDNHPLMPFCQRHMSTHTQALTNTAQAADC